MKITPLTYKETQLFRRYQARVFKILKHGSTSYIKNNLKDCTYNELWSNNYKGITNPVVVKFFNEELKINTLKDKLIAFKEIKGLVPIPYYKVNYKPDSLADSIQFQLAIKGITLAQFEREVGIDSIKKLDYNNLCLLKKLKKTYLLNIKGFFMENNKLHLEPTIILNILKHGTKINNDSGTIKLKDNNLQIGDTVFVSITTNTADKNEVDKKILNILTNIVDN